jgi:DegV family protein with EDD domain
MTEVRVVTDSSVRFLQPQFASHRLITLAPATVRWHSNTLVDHPRLGLEGARGLFGVPGDPPTAEAPSARDFEQIYARLQHETDRIISIHTSSALDGSYENARRASEQFRGRCDIQVIDSHSACAGLGMLAAAAASAAEQGADMEDLVRLVLGMISRLYMVIFLDELHYLERDRLISRSQSILGGMLGIIPFLTMENGRLIPMEKVRTRLRALEKLVEFVAEFAQIEQLAILQSGPGASEEAGVVAERLLALYPQAPITHLEYGPSLATHVGINALGVVVLESSEEAL